MKFSPKKLSGNVNVSEHNPLWELAKLLTKFIALCVGIYLVLGFAVESSIQRLDLKTENQLMKLMHSTSNSSVKSASPLTEKAKVLLLETTLAKLKSQSALSLPELHIKYSADEMVNAFAYPDGTIEVHGGLLEKLNTENELAFVLAHEVGHFAYRDNLKALGRGFLLVLVANTFLGADNGLSKLVTHSLSAAESKFSQGQESRADQFALELLNKTYGHVGGASSSFAKILKTEDPEFLYIFASHPNPKQRLASIQEQIKIKNYIVLPQKSLVN